MNTKQIILGLTASSLLATSVMAYSATSENTSSNTGNTAITANAEQESEILKISNEGYAALREVQMARLAIFNGDTDKATQIVGAAEDHLQGALKTAGSLSVKTAKSGADLYVPVDVSIALSEGFKLDEEKASHIKKANSFLAQGHYRKAVDVLKLANIDVTVSAALIPAKLAAEHVQDAAKLMTEKKYYEANLALKAIEDLIIIDSYGVDAIPVQGQG